LIAASHDIYCTKFKAILNSALQNEIVKNKKRIFYLLGFLNPACEINDLVYFGKRGCGKLISSTFYFFPNDFFGEKTDLTRFVIIINYGKIPG
jgi:hypothetical protein